MNTTPVRHFLRYLELYLSGIGLLAILFIPRLVAHGDGVIWRASAITATVVAVLDSVLLWVIRRRQSAVRQQAIAEIQVMLQDLVRNKIALLIVDTYATTADPHQRDENVERINQTVQVVLDILDSISEESLQTWQSKYGDIAKPPRE